MPLLYNYHEISQGQLQGLAELIRFNNGSTTEIECFSELGNKNAFLMPGYKDNSRHEGDRVRTQYVFIPQQTSVSDGAWCCVRDEMRTEQEKGPI